jgi:hypothetical protein
MIQLASIIDEVLDFVVSMGLFGLLFFVLMMVFGSLCLAFESIKKWLAGDNCKKEDYANFFLEVV